MTSRFSQHSDLWPSRCTPIGCLLIGLLMSAGAVAGPQRPIDLRWEAPPGCPQEGDVRNRIQKLLGPGGHDTPLRAEGTITRVDGRFHLELVVHVGDVAGTRSLGARSCEDLAGAAAVEIGLLVHSVEDASKPDPSGTQTTTSPPVSVPPVSPVSVPETSGTTSGASADGTSGSSPQGKSDVSSAARVPDRVKSEVRKEVEPEATEPPPRTETPRRWHILVQAPIVALGVGPLPPPAFGTGFSLGLEHARWQVQVQGLGWRRQNVPATGFPGYGADVDRLAAALWTCREGRFDWFGLAPCLLAGLERVSASGTGDNITPITRHTMGASVGAGIQARIALASWIRLLAAVGAELLLVRPQLLVNGLGPLAPPAKGDPPDPPTSIYRFAPAALTATLSLEWAL